MTMPELARIDGHSEEPRLRSASIEVREPVGAELRACRAIVPEAFGRGVMPRLLVAVTSEPFRLLGAIALEPLLFEGVPAWRLRLHVVRGSRRQGIGRRLVLSLMERSLARGVGALIASHDSVELPVAQKGVRDACCGTLSVIA